MDKEDIGNFVLSNLKRGLTLEEIRQQLLSRGVFDYDIDEAISEIDVSPYVGAKAKTKSSEKEESGKKELIEGWDADLSKSNPSNS